MQYYVLYDYEDAHLPRLLSTFGYLHHALAYIDGLITDHAFLLSNFKIIQGDTMKLHNAEQPVNIVAFIEKSH